MCPLRLHVSRHLAQAAANKDVLGFLLCLGEHLLEELLRGRGNMVCPVKDHYLVGHASGGCALGEGLNPAPYPLGVRSFAVNLPVKVKYRGKQIIGHGYATNQLHEGYALLPTSNKKSEAVLFFAPMMSHISLNKACSRGRTNSSEHIYCRQCNVAPEREMSSLTLRVPQE